MKCHWARQFSLQQRRTVSALFILGMQNQPSNKIKRKAVCVSSINSALRFLMDCFFSPLLWENRLSALSWGLYFKRMDVSASPVRSYIGFLIVSLRCSGPAVLCRKLLLWGKTAKTANAYIHDKNGPFRGNRGYDIVSWIHQLNKERIYSTKILCKFLNSSLPLHQLVGIIADCLASPCNELLWPAMQSLH